MRETCNSSYTTAETNNLTLIAAAIELERPLEILQKGTIARVQGGTVRSATVKAIGSRTGE